MNLSTFFALITAYEVTLAVSTKQLNDMVKLLPEENQYHFILKYGSTSIYKFQVAYLLLIYKELKAAIKGDYLEVDLSQSFQKSLRETMKERLGEEYNSVLIKLSSLISKLKKQKQKQEIEILLLQQA